MKLPRRRLLHLAAGAASTVMTANGLALAQPAPAARAYSTEHRTFLKPVGELTLN
jgi:hypothetical protein